MPFRCKLTLRPELAWCALALLALRLSATASVDVSQHELPFAQVGTLLDATSGAASQEIAAANVADIASSPRPELALEPARLALMTAAPTRERSPHQDLTPLLANPPPELIERYPKTRVWGFGLPGPERIESGPSLTNRTHWGCELSWLGLASGYAFEVDADHSYFVGQNALLVHNACGPRGLSVASKEEIHHAIPWDNKTFNHQAHDLVSEAGVKLKTYKPNMRAVEGHAGPHSRKLYHPEIRRRLDAGYLKVGGTGQAAARAELDSIIQAIWTDIGSGKLPLYRAKDVIPK